MEKVKFDVDNSQFRRPLENIQKGKPLMDKRDIFNIIEISWNNLLPFIAGILSVKFSSLWALLAIPAILYHLRIYEGSKKDLKKKKIRKVSHHDIDFSNWRKG